MGVVRYLKKSFERNKAEIQQNCKSLDLFLQMFNDKAIDNNDIFDFVEKNFFKSSKADELPSSMICREYLVCATICSVSSYAASPSQGSSGYIFLVKAEDDSVHRINISEPVIRPDIVFMNYGKPKMEGSRMFAVGFSDKLLPRTSARQFIRIMD